MKTKAPDYRLYGIVGAAALVVTVGGSFGVCALQTRHAMSQAETRLGKHFPALAAETIEPYRKAFSKSERGCKIMMETYFQTRSSEKLEWASQACLEAGFEIPESFMGAAAAKEIAGRDGDALQILGTVAGRFDKTPDIFYRMAQIFKRNKRDAEATAAYLKASERAPQNNQLSLEALEYFSAVQKWPEARQMAEKLSKVDTDNPEVKLVIARALIQGGAKDAAQPVINQARELMSKNPQFKNVLEQAYGDVLSGGNLAAGAPSAAGRSVASEKK